MMQDSLLPTYRKSIVTPKWTLKMYKLGTAGGEQFIGRQLSVTGFVTCITTTHDSFVRFSISVSYSDTSSYYINVQNLTKIIS